MPRRVALIGTAYKKAPPLIRYSTLRRRQCRKINKAALNQNAEMMHNLGSQFIRGRIIPNTHRVVRLTRELHCAQTRVPIRGDLLRDLYRLDHRSIDHLVGLFRLLCRYRAHVEVPHAELRAWCINSGHTVSHEYVERESGRKGAERRKQFAALFDDAAKKKFDCVLFWALDRFSREGMAQTIAHLQCLMSYGVAFHSYTEPHLATDNELVRNILLALLSSLAKLEAQKISDRTKAVWPAQRPTASDRGPKLGIEIRQKIAQRAKKGETPYAIAKALGIDRHTVAKYAPLPA